jgi:hypothetical protein
MPHYRLPGRFIPARRELARERPFLEHVSVRWPRTLAVLVVVLVTASAPRARADEPTAADSETALQLYKEGKDRRDRGDLPAALEKLRAAYALVETPITALELGRTYAMMGKLLEAREILLSVARLPVRKNESKKATEARAEAEKMAGALKPRLATLAVRVKNEKKTPKLTIDGVVIPSEAAAAPRIVNPGAHVVVVDVDGRTRQAEVTLREGESRELAIEAPAPGGPEPTPTPTPVEPTEPSASPGRSPLVYAGFGTAIVGLAVGGVTGVLTLSKASSLDETCRGNSCPPSSQSDLDSASTMGTISTVAFAVAGVGLVVGAAGLFLFDPKPAPASSPGARLVVTPGGAALRGTF